jgi:Ca2+-binding RTX toxin-like protein
VIGCAVLLLVVGCAGARSRAPQEEQGRSPGEASEEARCGETQPIDRYEEGWVTNDMSGCFNGGLLSGTDSHDLLDGKHGDDEIRGLGANDVLIGGVGSDVIYGGSGDDFLKGSTYLARDPVMSKDVLYGGPGRDELSDLDGGDDVLYGGDGDEKILSPGKGEDVIYGGDGNDFLDAGGDGHRDKLYCDEGKDEYGADKLDYVSGSCEVKTPPGGAM